MTLDPPELRSALATAFRNVRIYDTAEPAILDLREALRRAREQSRLASSTSIEGPKAEALEESQTYEGFIQQIGADIGEIELDDHEPPHIVKRKVRQAAFRLGIHVKIWDAGGRVYFRRY